ncbi:MAG: MarR family transcriptional regulator [Propionibacteriales bacterium]|nr:MarR family transcriptional regulator [Propionibacteriales bacterium]
MSQDADRTLAWLELHQASALLRSELSRRLEAEADMTVSDRDVLWYLANTVDRRLTMSDIAGRLMMSRSGVTRLVDRLERRGWVRREVVPENRRQTFAALTTAGTKAARRSTPVAWRGQHELFDQRLTATDVADLRRVLGKLLRRLDVLDGRG